jgi:hypothetical protein
MLEHCPPNFSSRTDRRVSVGSSTRAEPGYRIADLEVKKLAAEPGRYSGRCAMERLGDGTWFLVCHESASHFRYVAILYHRTTDGAVLKQYPFRLVKQGE